MPASAWAWTRRSGMTCRCCKKRWPRTTGMAHTFHPFLEGHASAAAARWWALPAWRDPGPAWARGLLRQQGWRGGVLRACGASAARSASMWSRSCLATSRRPDGEATLYAMPFLLTAEAFARRAISNHRPPHELCGDPWQMGIVAKLMRLLPNPLFDRLFAGRGRKASARRNRHPEQCRPVVPPYDACGRVMVAGPQSGHGAIEWIQRKAEATAVNCPFSGLSAGWRP